MGKRIIKKEIVIPNKKNNNLCEPNYILVNNKLEKVDYSCKKNFITKIPFVISPLDILNIYNINTKEDFDKHINNLDINFKSVNQLNLIIDSWIFKNIDFIKKDFNIFINIILSIKKYYEKINTLSDKELINILKNYIKDYPINENNYNIHYTDSINNYALSYKKKE
jgi:hypothetical protein